MSRAQAKQAMRLMRSAGISLKEAWRRVKGGHRGHGGGSTAKGKGKGRGGYRPKRRGGHKKKGILFGLTAYDFATIGYNVEQFGVPDAIESAIAGDWRSAGSNMASALVSNIPTLIVGNILLYVGKKVAQKVIAPAARRYLV